MSATGPSGGGGGGAAAPAAAPAAANPLAASSHVSTGLAVLLQGRLLACLDVRAQLRLLQVSKGIHALARSRVRVFPSDVVRLLPVVEELVQSNNRLMEASYDSFREHESDSDWDEDAAMEEAFEKDYPELTSLVETALRAPIVGTGNGVQVADEPVLPPAARAELMGLIDRLAAAQAEPDFHPGSHGVVRDIVHPALFCFVRGESPFVPSEMLAAPGVARRRGDGKPAPRLAATVAASGGGSADGGGESAPPTADMWGRPFEDSKYQWMPAYFHVDGDGTTTIEDYINGIPRAGNGGLYAALERLFARALPRLEQAWTYCKHAEFVSSREAANGYEFAWADADEADQQPRVGRFESLRGRRLQVVTKIVDYVLQPGQSYEGVWHVEGMSHECIVATSVYVIDRDPALQGGELRFKRAFTTTEAAYVGWETGQNRLLQVDQLLADGLMPLGTVDTPHGRLVTFPNSHVHKVARLSNEGSRPARRRIVVFFLINPEVSIVSTKEVPHQAVTGSMTLAQAKAHRLELMRERKLNKQDFNVRELNLCEH